MLAVKNSQGRTVSLLNEELPRLSNLTSSSQHHHHHHNKTDSAYFPTRHSAPQLQHHHSSSSTASARSSDASAFPYSPGSNPPSLSRSDSSDSGAGPSPSPVTPTSTEFEPVHELRQTLPRKFSSSLEGLPSLSTLRLQAKIPPARSPMDFHQQLPADFAFTSAAVAPAIYDPLGASQLTPVTAVGLDPTTPVAPPSLPSAPPTQGVFPAPISASKASAKKNQYPCPLAKSYNCGEFFTTSGHAARHAKKHTGKKDAICPECGKGFTRKDNMEQHRRTHAGGRNKSSHSSHSESSTSSKPASSKDSEESKARHKARQQHRKSRPSSISTATAPPPLSQPLPTLQQQQQPLPMTTTTSLPPQGDMLDPALREQNLSNFFSPTTDYSFGFPMAPGQMPAFPAPQAPMSLMSTASRDRGSLSPHTLAPQATKPVSPSAAPLSTGMDKLDILAEASSRRSSE